MAALPQLLSTVTPLGERQAAALQKVGTLTRHILAALQRELESKDLALQSLVHQAGQLVDRVTDAGQSQLRVLAGNAAQAGSAACHCHCCVAVQKCRMRLQATRAKVSFAKAAVLLDDELEFETALLETVRSDFQKLTNGELRETFAETHHRIIQSALRKLELGSSLRTAAEPALLPNDFVQELMICIRTQFLELDYKQTVQATRVQNVRRLLRELEKDTFDLEAATEAQLMSHLAQEKVMEETIQSAKSEFHEFEHKCQQAEKARDRQQKEVQEFLRLNFTAFYALAGEVLGTTVSDMADAG